MIQNSNESKIICSVFILRHASQHLNLIYIKIR
nr:MAG TPA: hypothetical protein [Caudoviricetes sp.]